MSLDFKSFKKDLEIHFNSMTESSEKLFEVALDKGKLYDIYLESIPEAENPIFKVNRKYDCVCCRQFIKRIGNVVAIKDGKLISIWDFDPMDSGWGNVVKNLSDYVKQFPIAGVFVSANSSVGTDHSLTTTAEGNAMRFDHFFVKLPDNCRVLWWRDTVDTICSQYRSNRDVFYRGLSELTIDSLDIVLELINQGSLYRGEEYKHIVEEFRKFKVCFDKLSSDKEKELFSWEQSVKVDGSITKIRNTAIGTLLVNLSENMDLEEAVSKYESTVAPTNYKRSKPIFTKKMLEDAQKTITELGYLESLVRRYANADDITVNNILFMNRDTAKRVQGGATSLFEQLEKEATSKPKKFDRVEEISIDKFIKEVVPTTSEIEAYVEGKHIPNFVSLIAPVKSDSKTMFKWDNNFSWAYTGNVTDSMVKQNVAKAGGKVDGVLRFSIQWNDTGEWDRNDEDAHCIEPSGNEIYFRHVRNPRTGGNLDVDIINPLENVPAVENITWPVLSMMDEGTYKFFVHCYSECGGRSGFRAEIEFNGQIYSFDYAHPLRQNERIPVADVTLKGGKFTIAEKLPSNCSSQEVWGIKTNEFTPVKVLCYSPNYWNEQTGIGNKHYFFMLKGCVNPELPNSWYNEFLNGELYPQHRKVMEALSAKAHVLDTEDQLSGIGFSSTLRNELVVKVKGSTERLLKIKF